MGKKPLIGITLDSCPSGGYSTLAWYALREEYFRSVAALGAVPIGLSHEHNCIDDFIENIDGLILSGGDFDIPPNLYGDSNINKEVVINDSRTRFEWDLTQKALDIKMPILGICAGHQLLNVMLGGTLIQHIPDEIPNAQEHKQPTERTETWHRANIVENTLLHKIIGTTQIEVNSSHHQAVKDIGDNVVINAIAPDGVIEGIEYLDHPFCLGIEWHPEIGVTSADKKIIAAFLDACKSKPANRSA